MDASKTEAVQKHTYISMFSHHKHQTLPLNKMVWFQSFVIVICMLATAYMDGLICCGGMS